jgi:transcriptional regulator with XRE-family HTH domain
VTLPYFEQRAARDPAFRAAREAERPRHAFRRALIGARLKKGLTQKQLAERIGTQQPAIARLESGESEPRLEMIQRLSAALQVSFEVFPDASVEVHDHEITAS